MADNIISQYKQVKKQLQASDSMELQNSFSALKQKKKLEAGTIDIFTGAYLGTV